MQKIKSFREFDKEQASQDGKELQANARAIALKQVPKTPVEKK